MSLSLSRQLTLRLSLQGYALVEYESRAEAEKAIAGASGAQLLEQTLLCDFAFVRPPVGYVRPLLLLHQTSRELMI